MVSCVPGSPMDCAAITPQVSPISTSAGCQGFGRNKGRRRPDATASEHRTDLHLFDTRTLDRAGDVFVDLLVHLDYDVAVVVLDLLERHAADDAVAQGLDDLADSTIEPT